ncbi:MAG: cytochrome b/b6 domain-containing protein [Archangium sp.]|nr:cytochrome b/b6 domain-containing protein [Archangium sp.]
MRDEGTRLLHWVLALVVGLNLLVLEEGSDVHRAAGYLGAVAMVVRGLWGRRGLVPFGNLPSVAANRWAALVAGGIWACIAGLAVTGWMLGLDAYFGEEWLEEAHEVISHVLTVLVLLHVAGLITDGVRHRRHTWLSMVTGKAPEPR